MTSRIFVECLLLTTCQALKLVKDHRAAPYDRSCPPQRGMTNASPEAMREFNVDATCLHGDNTRVLDYSHKETVINYYPDTPAWLNFRTIDLLQAHSATNLSRSQSAEELLIRQQMKPENFQFYTCYKSLQQRGEMRIESLGPFFTSGGYSWVMISWSDVANLSQTLQERHSIDILAISLTAVDESGTKISHPPLHQHHTHVTPGKSIYRRDFSKCSQFNLQDCFEQGYVLTHGDSECVEEEGGLDCVDEILPTGYAYTWKEPWGVWGDVNDVRQAGSEPLQWYYRLAIHWRPKDGVVRPISQLIINNPSDSSLFGLPFDSPMDRDHLYWSSWRAPPDAANAEVLSVYGHSHGGNFVESFLIEIDPSELSLLPADTAGRVTFPEDLKVSSIEHFRTSLLQQVSSDQVKVHHRPRMGPNGFLRFGGTCYKPWVVKEGQTYVIVGFFKKTDPTLSTFPNGVNRHHLSLLLLAATKTFVFDAWAGNVQRWNNPAFKKSFIKQQGLN